MRQGGTGRGHDTREAVAQANTVALAALWSQAQSLANEALRSVQASWEAERGKLDAMRQELAEAYETQAAEIERLNAQLVQQAEALEHERTNTQDALQLAQEAERSAAVLAVQLDAAHLAIAQAEARASQFEKNTQQARQAEQGARIAEQAYQAPRANWTPCVWSWPRPEPPPNSPAKKPPSCAADSPP